ncbi:hypothetical protein MMC20_003335 [Loxospora ochrophaea]|nr:hypothetical protein [Loxospora ochrophaea]
MAIKDRLSPRSSSSPGGLITVIVNLTLRFFQLVLALTVAGLYGVDLNNARKHGVYADSKWVYAEVVAGFASLTALIYMVPFVKSYVAFGWDLILFIMWIALFGIFGKMYIHAKPQEDAGIQRMKNAVWVDLVNMLLWLVTAVMGALLFFSGGRRSLHTGRATV